MTEIDLAKAKLVDTIGHYNMNVSQIYQFSFNKTEIDLFAKMMLEFHNEMTELYKKSQKKQLNKHIVSSQFICGNQDFSNTIERCQVQCYDCKHRGKQ